MNNLFAENQIYQKNLGFFTTRFLQLYKIIEAKLGKLPENLEIIPTKADASKFTAKYNNQFLH